MHSVLLILANLPSFIEELNKLSDNDNNINITKFLKTVINELSNNDKISSKDFQNFKNAYLQNCLGYTIDNKSDSNNFFKILLDSLKKENKKDFMESLFSVSYKDSVSIQNDIAVVICKTLKSYENDAEAKTELDNDVKKTDNRQTELNTLGKKKIKIRKTFEVIQRDYQTNLNDMLNDNKNVINQIPKFDNYNLKGVICENNKEFISYIHRDGKLYLYGDGEIKECINYEGEIGMVFYEKVINNQQQQQQQPPNLELKGFYGVENGSYIHSVLSILSHISSFSTRLDNLKYNSRLDNIADIITELKKNLYESDGPVNVTNFKNAIASLQFGSEYNDGEEHDPIEFLIFLLSNLGIGDFFTIVSIKELKSIEQSKHAAYLMLYNFSKRVIDNVVLFDNEFYKSKAILLYNDEKDKYSSIVNDNICNVEICKNKCYSIVYEYIGSLQQIQPTLPNSTNIDIINTILELFKHIDSFREIYNNKKDVLTNELNEVLFKFNKNEKTNILYLELDCNKNHLDLTSAKISSLP